MAIPKYRRSLLAIASAATVLATAATSSATSPPVAA
jgi:hypothetical protein